MSKELVQGPQGNKAVDWRAMGNREDSENERPGSGVEDRRDNRDPTEVGEALLAEREAQRNGGKAKKLTPHVDGPYSISRFKPKQ